MGNQPSKGKDRSDAASISSRSSKDPGFDSYPSFSKSETKESSRSIRTSLKNKLPIGSSRTDSPRASLAALNEVDRSDAASTKSGKSARSNSKTHRASTDSVGAERPSKIDMPSPDDTAVEDGDEDQPPPSPSQSKNLGMGHDYQKMKEAEQTGEVDHVSEAPPNAAPSMTSIKESKAGESILMKNDVPIPVSQEELDKVANDRANAAPISQSVGGELDMGALKPVDLDDVISRLLDAGYTGKVQKQPPLRNAEITALCAAARQVFLSQPSLLELSAPVKIVGDVHGQYTDMIRMFEMCGFPPSSNYLFLGDYVDRGKQSLETILLLLAYKIKYPENFFLLRGNHECANVTRVYGFYDECKRRCNIKIWKNFIDVFNTLPIAAIVAGKIFCVHGGLSPSLSHMDDIRQIARPTDVPDYGLLNDLLWSDPADLTDTDWEANERGVSYCFGKKVILDFLQRHDFDLVCRAHMVVEDGYEFFGDRVLVTVFSAPNYCNEFDNWGAVMSVNAELLCSFELLKPLDVTQLKSHIKKARNERRKGLSAAGKQIVNSPPASQYPQSY